MHTRPLRTIPMHMHIAIPMHYAQYPAIAPPEATMHYATRPLCTLVHYSILRVRIPPSLPPGICKYAVWTVDHIRVDPPGICKYAVWTTSLLRSPGAFWLLLLLWSRVVVANPARTKEEAPLGPQELGEICPNCIFGNAYP